MYVCCCHFIAVVISDRTSRDNNKAFIGKIVLSIRSEGQKGNELALTTALTNTIKIQTQKT